MGGVDVSVDADAGRIVLSRGGRTLLDVGASDVGGRRVDATFEMQFGMFDIEESGAPFAFADKMRIDAVTDSRVDLTFEDAGGAAFAQGTLTPLTGGVQLAVTLAGGLDDAVVASTCAFHHAIGLGAQTHDVDHVGQRVPLWVSEQGIGTTDTDELPAVWQVVGRRHTSYAPMPAFVADNAAAYVVDTPAFSRLDLCATDPGKASFEAWQPRLALDVYAGDTPRQAQASMVDALGRPPLPPPWTFAPWNDAIFGSDNVRAVARRIRALGLPSSVIWTEDWRGGADVGGGAYRLDEDWGPDPVLYPDFADMVRDVNGLGFQQMVYFNSFVVQGADVFDEVTSRGLGIGAPLFSGPDKDFSPTTLVDLTNPDARAFVKQHFADAFALGVRGWMADYGEWLPVDDDTLFDGEDPHLVHNRFPVLWQQVNREAQQEAGLLDDSVVFVRSAHLGSQPLVQVIWAGDQRTSFDADDGLPTVLPIGIGLSTVGFPFFAHDVAGYQSATNPPGDKELFLRWTELGALSPVMRTHHGTNVTQNVNIFTDDDTVAHWRRYASLHVRLYPYLRALARAACGKGGAPLWTPLPLAYPADDAVWGLKDEVMLGPALLVAPVLTEGAVSRPVVFPSARFAPVAVAVDGALTAPAGDGAAVVGPATVDVDAPVADIPLFVAAGGIVPMTANVADTLLPGGRGLAGLETTEGDRVVVVGLGADGTFTEDSGASYALSGTGTDASSAGPGGVVDVTGDGVVDGDGFTLTLSGQPAARVTHVVFR